MKRWGKWKDSLRAECNVGLRAAVTTQRAADERAAPTVRRIDRLANVHQFQ